MILSISRNLHAPSSHDLQIRELLDRMETANCLVELPFPSDSIDVRELTSYIRAELNSLQQHVSESSLLTLANTIHQQIDKQCQIFYLLRLVLHETYFSHRRNDFDLFDLNMEDVVNVYIGKLNNDHQPVDRSSRVAFRSLRGEIRDESLCLHLQLHQLIAIGD